MMKVFIKLVMKLWIFGILVSPATQTFAQAANQMANPFEQFSKYDAQSPIQLDHGIWSEVLRKLVWKTGMSDRIFLGKEKLPTGTNIAWGNSSPYRLEGNKVFFHNVKEEQLKYLAGIKKAYEALPNKIPLETLHRNEQLAYWLNLHNITVLYEIAKAYPITDIRKLKKQGVWRNRSLRVMPKLARLNYFKATIYDHNIADLYNGQLGGGPGSSKGTNPAALLAAGNTPEYFDFINSKRGPPNKYPNHVKRLLKRMESRNMRRKSRGIVTIDEIEAPKEQPSKNHH